MGSPKTPDPEMGIEDYSEGTRAFLKLEKEEVLPGLGSKAMIKLKDPAKLPASGGKDETHITMYSSDMIINQLHGRWKVGQLQSRRLLTEDVMTTSDRRLKRDIKSLIRTQASQNGRMTDSPEDPQWVLRQLRPVSFRFRHKDAKSMGSGADESGSIVQDGTRKHYGFIADEIREIVPDAVRPMGGGGDFLAVAYQDLMAIAIAAQQANQEQVEVLQAHVQQLIRQLKLQESSITTTTSTTSAAPSMAPSVSEAIVIVMARLERLERLHFGSEGTMEALASGQDDHADGLAI